MPHYCDFCQVEHSSASCFHPGNQQLSQLRTELVQAREDFTKLQAKHDELAAIIIASKIGTQKIQREIIHPQIKQLQADLARVAKERDEWEARAKTVCELSLTKCPQVSGLEQQLAACREALKGLLMSADAGWLEHKEGHDWNEAVERAQVCLGIISKDAQDAGEKP